MESARTSEAVPCRSAGEEEGAEIVRLVMATNKVEDSGAAAETMIEEIKIAIATEADGKSAWRDIFTWGELQYFRRIILAFGTQAMQQLTGISKFLYISPPIETEYEC